MDVKRDLLDVTRDLVLTVGYSSDILHPNVLEKRPNTCQKRPSNRSLFLNTRIPESINNLACIAC